MTEKCTNPNKLLATAGVHLLALAVPATELERQKRKERRKSELSRARDPNNNVMTHFVQLRQLLPARLKTGTTARMDVLVLTLPARVSEWDTTTTTTSCEVGRGPFAGLVQGPSHFCTVIAKISLLCPLFCCFFSFPQLRCLRLRVQGLRFKIAPQMAKLCRPHWH